MNYGIKLIEMVCNLVEADEERKKELIKAYEETTPDNFVDGYEERSIDWVGDSLSIMLHVFYDNAFKYEESTYCEGYGKLVDFLYGLGVDVNDIVDELDEITNIGCFYDIEGNIISDDEEIRLMRNAGALYNLCEYVYPEDCAGTIWQFMSGAYKNAQKIDRILTECAPADADDIMKEWKVCVRRA